MWWLLIVIAIGIAAALYDAWVRQGGEDEDKGGWVYFIAAKDGPVGIGTSTTEPAIGNMGNMGPFPILMLYKVEVEDLVGAEAALQEELKPYRLHGDWFHRDACLSVISHLKGEH